MARVCIVGTGLHPIAQELIAACNTAASLSVTEAETIQEFIDQAVEVKQDHYLLDIRRETEKPEWLMQPVQQNHIGRKKKGRTSKW